MYVVSKDQAVRLVWCDTLNDAVLSPVRRNEPVEFGRPDDILQAVVLLDGLATILPVFIGKVAQAYVEA